MIQEMDLMEIFYWFHRHPELSYEEYDTTAQIKKLLKAADVKILPIPMETGLIAEVKGEKDGPVQALRCDIDALPITELTDLPYASECPGKMHACGHDIHAAVLFGVLQELNRSRDFDGTVLGLFQPAEECNPGGASKVLAERPFDDREIIAVIGEHVDSGLEVGEIGFCAGRFMASNDELRFRVRGRG